MTTKNLFLALAGFLMILAAVSNSRQSDARPFAASVTPLIERTIPAIADVTAMGNGVQLRIAADQSRVLTGDQDGVVMIEVEGRDDGTAHRTPVSLALVVDTSGSMAGEKIDQARAAAARLVSQLANGDVLTVVTYGRSASTIVESQELGADRSDVLAAIARISTSGNTCMSCGMEQAYTLLSDSPSGHVRRAVVLSDGQANQGITTPSGLAILASRAGDEGAVTATIGLGSDYNEELMSEVAIAGTGAYYFMPDAAAMALILEREFNALESTVATDVRVRVWADGEARVMATNVVGAEADKDGISLHVQQLGAGEIRRFVLPVDYAHGIDSDITASVSYLESPGTRTELEARISVEETGDSGIAEATIHADVVTHFELSNAVADIERAMEDAVAGNADDAAAELDRLAVALDGMGDLLDAEELEEEADNIRTLRDRVAAPGFSGRGEEGRNLMLQNAARSNEMQSGYAREQMYHDSTVY